MQSIEQLAGDAIEVRKRGRPKGARDNAPRARHGISRKEMLDRVMRLQQVGALAGTATKVLAALGDAGYWMHVIEQLEQQQDYGTIAKIVQFQQQMRDGRPHQQISVTSTNISLSAAEIARARSVVREITGQVIEKKALTAAPPNAFTGQGAKAVGVGEVDGGV